MQCNPYKLYRIIYRYIYTCTYHNYLDICIYDINYICESSILCLIIVLGGPPAATTASYVDELMFATLEGADTAKSGQVVESVEPAFIEVQWSGSKDYIYSVAAEAAYNDSRKTRIRVLNNIRYSLCMH